MKLNIKITLKFVAHLLFTEYTSFDFVTREININKSGKPFSLQTEK